MDKRIENFAKLAVGFGVNVREGEDVLINTPVESPELARLITKVAYEKGARSVSIDWRDDTITRLTYDNQSQETLNEVADWKIEKLKYQIADKKSNRISISAEDPDLLKGLDEAKISEAIRENSKATKEFVKYTMNDIVSWLVISVPTKKWAKKVFPDLSEDEAYDKLWKTILDVSRVEESWEATKKNWKDHINTLEEKAVYLNDHQFDKVHYKSSNGTDLWVKLPKDHIWMSAGSKNAKGDLFIPNIPTEEVFTAPQYDGVDGRLVATKPLVYNGVIINNFEFTFKDGKVIDFDAKEGKDTLAKMLDSDQGSKNLGEIALVPYDSPISNSNILFYNTLFDENASCHFALGKAYPTCLVGGAELKESELNSRGINDSLIHEDFMVGSSDLEITGYKNDEEFPIFENGNWAF
ncbi:aminopeptidase [Anaerococcus sp.]|uniref:aminopeptidase n=1 Tax=Anaerococcus sp. TaxID=1872515 RepID=UPI0029011DB2|nr:aminopeptidase [Anaerococcus sp.]MDU1828603.1 aminopeptidase [Anaerococcus sp.]MDU1865117.1 aminopeptidase [Anaerococcus sp.]